MSKWMISVDGTIDEDEGPFDTMEAAENAAIEWENDWQTGAEILEMSNPGDWPYNPNDCPTISVVEIDKD